MRELGTNQWVGRGAGCVVVMFGLAIVSASSLVRAKAADVEQPATKNGKSQPAALAHFRFEGNAKDENAENPPFEVNNTRFTGEGLYLNGKYEFDGGGEGYHAVCKTPHLDYTHFSVVLRCKPERLTEGKTNLLMGGTSYRWFGMRRSEAGNLTITFNNQAYAHEIKDATISDGKWSLVACGVDLALRKVTVYFNGRRAADIELPNDFKLAVVDSDFKDRDKIWSFTNYANGGVFQGVVAELIVYGTTLSAEELAAVPVVDAKRPEVTESAPPLAALGAKRLSGGFKSSWSPDGKQILVSALPIGVGIDRVDVESGEALRLIAPGKDPAFSPSGKQIAFVRGNDAQEEIWLADADGGNSRKLADGGFPSWWGDGKTLYYHSRSDWQIKSVDITAAERVVNDVALVNEAWYPAVSPDGNSIAYVGGGNLVVVNLQTKARLTRGLPGAKEGLVGWSPDSKRVAYSGYGSTDGAGVWVLELASAKAKLVAPGPYAMPSWSPDGKWLAFDLRAGDRWEVWAIETQKLDAIEAVEPPADRYAVPEGDIEKLLAFIQQVRQFRATNVNELMAHRTKGPAAIAAAGEKILALKPDESSVAYATARLAVLEPRLANLPALAADQRQELIGRLEAALTAKAAHGLEMSDVLLAVNAARSLEYGDDPRAAAEIHKRLAKLIGSEGPFAVLARGLEGTARRLDLVGNPLTLEGKTAAGDAFDWASYRGRVVLIDFWATWCGPCVAEVPNVRSLYERYHERGFDVVGISLDRDRAALDKFLVDKQIPWTTLHESGGQHPAAAYYGVNAIPTMLLVGRDGKVVSIKARGDELKRLLADLIGPPDESGDKPK